MQVGHVNTCSNVFAPTYAAGVVVELLGVPEEEVDDEEDEEEGRHQQVGHRQGAQPPLKLGLTLQARRQHGKGELFEP